LLFSGCTVKNDRLFQTKDEHIIQTKLTKVSNEDYKTEKKFEYTIRENDRLSIMVYIQSGAGSQQMNSILASKNVNTDIENQENIGLLVTQDGSVRLPLLGSVKLTGLTQDEASKLLIDEYKKYIRNPYVTVEIMNQRIIVVGEVKRPGIVPIVNGTMNLIEVISRSGDLTDLASRSNIKIIRGDLRDPEVNVVDISHIDNLKLSSLLLKPNDIVYVQPRRLKGYNKAWNEINPFFDMLSSILNPLVQRKTLIGP
jgi:polysaccharide export outer membrane protein